MQFIFGDHKRMRMAARAALVTGGVMLGLALNAPAADAQQQNQGEENSFALKGLGQATCNQYLQERGAESTAYVRFLSWTQGYLSAYNQMQSDTVDITPWQGSGLIASLITEYCKQNRDRRYFEAVAWLTGYWRDDRLQTRSEVVKATANDQTVTIYTEILRRAQEALAKRGHYNGPIDGQYGDGTRSALEAFQKANDIQQTGLPDQRSLFVLFQDRETPGEGNGNDSGQQ